MSETETATQGGAQAEPAAATVDPNAPGTEGAAATETETKTEPTEAEVKQSRIERRIAAMSARLSAGEQERARLAGENERLRSGATHEPDPNRALTQDDIKRAREEGEAQGAVRARVERFHEQGRASYPDWTERCQSLMAMGADSGLAELLVETPDGAKVAAALADDPEALEAIAGLRSERSRAIALGKFAAEMRDKPAPAARRVSNAPAPIRQLNGASARAEFNEFTATAEQLTAYYAKQLREKRGLN
jgi:hypothetical protein